MKRLFTFVIKVTAKTLKDNVGMFSAYAAFFMTVSFIPFLMLIISTLRFLPFSADELLSFALSFFPSDAKTLVSAFIAESYEKSGKLLISVTAVSTIWSASIGIFSVTKGLDSIYSRNESRGFISMRLISLLYTLVLPFIFLLCLVVPLFGSSIIKMIEFPSALNRAFVASGTRIVASFLMLTLFFAFMYKFVPKRKDKLLNQLPGAIITSIGWIAFSHAFAFYYENLSHYSYLYGSLSTIVFFMLWLFFCFYILFIGAEINNCIKK